MKIVRNVAVVTVALAATVALAQTSKMKMDKTSMEAMSKIEAKTLYDAFKQGRGEEFTGQKDISGVATFVGPDPYTLPSVEVAESAEASSRVLCVLPFSDYLKLRKVSKKDRVLIRGNVLGFADKYDYVVVKQCKIIEINGKKE